MKVVQLSLLCLVMMTAMSPSLSAPFFSTGNSNTDSLLGGAALGVAGGLLLGMYPVIFHY